MNRKLAVELIRTNYLNKKKLEDYVYALLNKDERIWVLTGKKPENAAAYRKRLIAQLSEQQREQGLALFRAGGKSILEMAIEVGATTEQFGAFIYSAIKVKTTKHYVLKGEHG